MLIMLSYEKVPYLLTILFAALGWTLLQFSSELTQSPVLEYSKTLCGNKETKVIYTFTNLSNDTLFTELHAKIMFRTQRGKELVKDDLKLQLRAVPPHGIGQPNKPEMGTRSIRSETILDYVSFHIPRLSPGAIVTASVKSNKKFTPQLVIECDKAIKILESSYQTGLLKYRFTFLLVLIAVWSLLIMFYIAYLQIHPKRQTDTGG